jgi:predicted transposase YbfD/YdcC
VGADSTAVIAIDGKTLRRSFGRAAGKSALHVVTGFDGEAGLGLGQTAVPGGGGGNTITAAHALLGIIDVKGMPATADAIHCQGETPFLVLEHGVDCLFALKKNRPAAPANVETWFTDLFHGPGPDAGNHRCRPRTPLDPQARRDARHRLVVS